MGETRREKKGGQEGICQGIESAKVSSRIPIPVLVPREAKERVRARAVQNDTVFALSLSPPLSRSRFFLSRAFVLALSLSLFPFTTISVRLSPRSVREPSHSQKTQNADGHVSRRHREVPAGKGPKRKAAEQRMRASMRVGYPRVCAMAPGDSPIIFLPFSSSLSLYG